MAVVGQQLSESEENDSTEDSTSMLGNCFAAEPRVRQYNPQQMQMVPAGPFYATYHGHDARYLEQLLDGLLALHHQRTTIYLAGDSSLDNKTWLFNQGAPAERWRPAAAHAPAVNGYEQLLQPPRMVCDVTYWMNQILFDLGAPAFALNTAIEATTLASRVGGVQCCIMPSCCGLYEQEVIRDRIRPGDMLVISVGGNDIALAPSIFTVLAMVLLMLTPWPFLFWFHPAVAYFIGLFRFQVQCYADRLTQRTRPAKIGVCMIYNLDERNGESWANMALCILCYTCFPSMLQRRMRLVFELATCRIQVPGSEVVPIALADALDGCCTEDYHQRVEPSVIGGQKMLCRALSYACSGSKTRLLNEVVRALRRCPPSPTMLRPCASFAFLALIGKASGAFEPGYLATAANYTRAALDGYLQGRFGQPAGELPAKGDPALDPCPILNSWPDKVEIDAPNPCNPLASAGGWTSEAPGSGMPLVMTWSQQCSKVGASLVPETTYSLPSGGLFGTSRLVPSLMGNTFQLNDCVGYTRYYIDEKVYHVVGEPDAHACEIYGSCDGSVFLQFIIRDHAGRKIAHTPYLRLFQSSFNIEDTSGLVVAHVERIGHWNPMSKMCSTKGHRWLVKFPDLTLPGASAVFPTAADRWPVAKLVTIMATRDASRLSSGLVSPSVCEVEKTGLLVICMVFLAVALGALYILFLRVGVAPMQNACLDFESSPPKENGGDIKIPEIHGLTKGARSD
ncbi:hypothetical protein AK812_SmicGene17009 [Symbiodinium microadriaticum]|uniref:Uncharacterized protein n=1 Tax=Symbiodinium microadriaticum TaxID=2951 RepID=A0A1Q9DYW0_SYMMI|nr:hypothetical protein AK812_SmicGene17009 [Symbiodinium microadriaticum]